MIIANEDVRVWKSKKCMHTINLFIFKELSNLTAYDGIAFLCDEILLVGFHSMVKRLDFE